MSWVIVEEIITVCFISLLQDFRNYQYTLPVVKGLVVDMEVRKTSIKIPSNRYNEVSFLHQWVYLCSLVS